VAGLVNLEAVVARLARVGEWTILCAGSHGRFSLEDALCAGAIVASMRARFSDIQVNDAGKSAEFLYRSAGEDLPGSWPHRGGCSPRFTLPLGGRRHLRAGRLDSGRPDRDGRPDLQARQVGFPCRHLKSLLYLHRRKSPRERTPRPPRRSIRPSACDRAGSVPAGAPPGASGGIDEVVSRSARPFALLLLGTASASADHTVWFNPSGAILNGSGGFATPPTAPCDPPPAHGRRRAADGDLTIPLALSSDGEIDSILVCIPDGAQDFPSRLTGIRAPIDDPPDRDHRPPRRIRPIGRASRASASRSTSRTLRRPGAVHSRSHLARAAHVHRDRGDRRAREVDDPGRPPRRRGGPPIGSRLSPGRPNPFAGTTRISYRLSEPGMSTPRLRHRGRQVRTLVDAAKSGRPRGAVGRRGEDGRALPPDSTSPG